MKIEPVPYSWLLNSRYIFGYIRGLTYCSYRAEFELQQTSARLNISTHYLHAFSNSDHPPWEEALTSTNSKITHKILTNDKALSLIGCMKSVNNGGSKPSRLGIYSSQVPAFPSRRLRAHRLPNHYDVKRYTKPS
jgi:hypothetical protein